MPGSLPGGGVRDLGAHGKPTREGVAAALPVTEREGLLGHVTFDAGRNWGDAPLYWYRIGAGNLTRTYSGVYR